jgi:hypothetical protein
MALLVEVDNVPSPPGLKQSGVPPPFSIGKANARQSVTFIGKKGESQHSEATLSLPTITVWIHDDRFAALSLGQHGVRHYPEFRTIPSNRLPSFVSKESG